METWNSENAKRCAHIKTLTQLIAALRDPTEALIIDLGGRQFTPDGSAGCPRAAVTLKRSKSGHERGSFPENQDYAAAQAQALNIESRYGHEWNMEEASTSSQSVPSVNRESSQHSIYNLGSPSQPASVRRRTLLSSEGHTHARFRTPRANAATRVPRPVPIRRNGSQTAEDSEDTGDDAHAANEQPDSRVSAMHQGGVQRLQNDRNLVRPLSPGGLHGSRRNSGRHNVCENMVSALRDREPRSFIDIIRPGTILCNGSIEVPENMMIRILTSCTLQNLTLRGPGLQSEEYWGYSYPGLVSVGCQQGLYIDVDMQSVTLKRVGHSNGIKVQGPASVKMSNCCISNCRRNGVIVRGPSVRVAMRGCTLCENDASGLWVIAGGAVSAEDCNFQDNQCNGAAVWDLQSSFLARACTFRRNTVNGLRLLYGSSGALLDCSVSDNQEQGIEAGESGTRLRVQGGSITCNNHYALKSYTRASVFLKGTEVNRGQVSASSIQAQGADTHVQTRNCVIHGQSEFTAHAVFSQDPPASP